ncbi:Bromodomain containing protein [Tritrichomonas foetus]|uniref:Bromodomain containing protein n=1 Tax=Tritrichomonas foetus TaxID=1144522 RepID=A0A1J4KPT8_9EUKA|nr:Bromodomain containing protein [Tritrichomonas foetus]|eukprot:OHT13122.1 Bromodomain containing protein [Tritrichomonas foetus]
MSKISKRIRVICIDIMDKLMKLPCAKVFLDPVDPVKDNVPTYLQVIKHPIHLRLINKRLLNNEYSGISHWDKDMNLVWNNAEKFYQKTSYIGILANELHKHYDKEYQRIKLQRLAKWSRAVFGFKSQLEKLFDTIPPVVGALAQFPEKSSTEKLKPFSEEELNIFIRMSLYLRNSHDSKKMAQIVQHFQPDIVFSSLDNEIDVNDLEITTLYALRDYVTYRLAEMNLVYPK